MKRTSIRWLALLLCILLLAGCGEAPASPSSPTQEPKNTLAPSSSATSSDIPSSEETPAPAETPAPTMRELAEGCWLLRYSELEGESVYYDTDEKFSGNYEVLRFLSDGTVDYLRASAYFEASQVNSIPVTDSQNSLDFTVENEYGPLDFTVLTVTEDTLEADVTIHYFDGTISGATHVYQRTDASALRDYPRPLREPELEQLNYYAQGLQRSFFYCTYSRPEEIDWNEVLYDGAGLSVELTQEQLDYYEDFIGWPVELDLEAIPGDALRDFVQRTTGTDYRLARNPLWYWDYLPAYDIYCHQHGDTNAQPIEFEGGWRWGDDYYLDFSRNDWENSIDERWFIAHVRKTAEGWQYLAVWPQAASRPQELVTIDFYDEQPAADHVIATEPLDSDDPYGWLWVLVTAQQDGVTVRMDRCNPRSEKEASMQTGMGAAEPNERLGEFQMHFGETLAVRVQQTWYPYQRISAAWDNLWGDFWFGSDNYLHLDEVGDQEHGLPPQHWIMGHDYYGEGRSPYFWSEEGLVNFLKDQEVNDAWLWHDARGEVSAMLAFHDYRSLTVVTPNNGYELFLDYVKLNAGTYEAPDLLVLEKYYEDDDWSVLPAGFFSGDALGNYTLEAEQLDGEQILTLRQNGSGPCALGYLLGAPKTQTEFEFHRYIGSY